MVGNFRFGASIVVPAGLSKRWEDQPAKGYANEFTLETIEFNPTVAYKITDSLAIAGGVRAVYTSGVVKSASTASRDMDGDSIDFGYNLAISYKPIKPLSLAVTYRSNIDLTVDGTAKLYSPDNGDYTGPKIYDGDAKVTVPIPAALNIAAAYTFNEGNEYSTTVELVYERTYWSSYETLDFDYAGSIGPLTPGYDDPIAKDWEDTNTFRVGVTQKIKAFDAMVGFAYDETPVPEKTLNFELPDSDALIFSAGMMYNMTDSWSIGGAVLMDVKKDRTKAISLYKRACTNNNAVSCFNLGLYHEQGKRLPKDLSKARHYYDKACNAKNADACLNLGLLYYYGRGVKSDVPKSEALFGKACDLGSTSGCDNYAIVYKRKHAK
jgi:long-chain fatty acid transport protein